MGYLKIGIDGMKVRRQHPIGIYVVDFYCHKIKLIIEVDGNIHDKNEIKNYDKKREDHLKSWGYSILRFSNEKVLKEPEVVLAEINSLVQSLIKGQNNSKVKASL
jgi:very-short-patch-repair endonuclease